MRVLFIGDIVGEAGREIVRKKLRDLRQEKKIDAVIANAENAAGGSGITQRIAEELKEFGVDVITSGDHIWKKREIYDFLTRSDFVVRPANYPVGAPGRGATIVEIKGKGQIGVLNLMGRVFMEALDCPFRKAEKEITELRKKTAVILVDMHAEATSEKVAMGWFLDGKVTGVVGTHTHIQTADEKILPGGTAYITDCGMTGPYDSVIGRKKELIIERFLTQLPNKFEVADRDIQMHGVMIDVDTSSGKATAVKRVQVKE
ncbi:MAG TPA: TIGR00282 family metallophosphoesterase [Candidatus Omnitrophota bacterium]|nr:TIGR00282 family metallophosphoesterase [Candidatus Omnitrophota bacterium]